jgi:predicted Fe-S protein YdhL (DUF1289 family)
MDAASRLCEGCLRTIDEIAAWGTMADDDKRAVWRQIERRRAVHGVALHERGEQGVP